jgi:hypothetical protein
LSQELDAEKMVENIEKYGSAEGDPGAKTTAEKPVEEAGQQIDAAPAPTGFSFKSPDELLKHKLKYKADEKEVEEDIQTILKRASLGYHAAQKMNQFNTERSQWEEKVKAAEALNQKWSRYDEYAKQNPDWYNHWEQAWQNRGQNLAEPQTADGNIEARINALLEDRLKPVNELLSHHEQQKLQERVQSEDRDLEQAIMSIRKSHPDIDFDATDPESGKSLEFKVMEFGVKQGIKDFGVAFKAFYHDELVKRAAEKAKDALSKETQTKVKAGIVPEKTSSQKPAPNLKGLNYDQTMQLAAKELGIQL